jgi:hypothetical protein
MQDFFAKNRKFLSSRTSTEVTTKFFGGDKTVVNLVEDLIRGEARTGNRQLSSPRVQLLPIGTRPFPPLIPAIRRNYEL